jgi:hypothetical protein
MSEVMTSEAIVEAEWLLAGYWAKPRFAFQTDNGAWSDVDVLAYHPEMKRLVVSESKVQGPKNHVFAYTTHTRKEYGSIIEYDGDNYFSYLRHLPILCRKGVVFDNFKKMVSSVTVQLVCNYSVSADMKAEVSETLNKKLSRSRLPCKTRFQLDTTLDVIARIIVAERDSGQGKRYGNPILDIAREINRYFYPAVRYAGRGSQCTEKVKKEMVTVFLNAIGLPKNET